MISLLASNSALKRATLLDDHEDSGEENTLHGDLQSEHQSALQFSITSAAMSSLHSGIPVKTVAELDTVLAQSPLESSESVIESAVSDVVAAVEAVTEDKVMADDIESIYHHAAYSTGFVGVSVAVSIVEKTTLLLKNGLAYVGLDVSPLSLSVPVELTEDTGKWTTWRQNTKGNYELKNYISGNWTAVQGERVDTSPVEQGELAGSYVRTQSETVGSTVFTRQNGITLNADGQFVISDAALVTSGGLGSITSQTPLNLYSYEDADSSSQLFSAGFQPELNGETSNILQRQELLADNRDRYGTYRLLGDGATLELTNSLGEVSNRLFIRLQGRVAMQGFSYIHHRPSADYFDIDRLLRETGPVKADDGDWKDIVTKANNKPKKVTSDSVEAGGRGSGDG